jgi:hypothetical protein
MRNKRFIAQHRSGSLNKEQHIQLIKWACDCAEIAVARAVGHAVATAHMADHSLGAALYALKAVKNAGKSIDAERKWQNEQLPSEIMEIVLTARSKKEQDLKI